MDIPNDRSSHTVATPRGGGIAIIISFFIGIIYLYFMDEISQKLFFLLLTSLPIVIVSLVDDIMTLSSKIRFLVQLFCAIIALFIIGGVNSIDFILFEINGWWINIIAVISIIWITNLYNFLDGIDGYAGSQAVIAGIGSYLILNNTVGLLLAICSLGFLFFNWPKASIFMGDVGSATLGFIFAVLCFYDTSNGNIFVWLILLSLFWFDATLTLIRRYKNKEKITQAHKKHAYQRLVQSGLSHKQVTLGFIVINILFLVLLIYLPTYTYIYLFFVIITVLFVIMRLVDKKKAFDK
jgi:Fuc2NAc and GlcNAc transferase